ncbi:MAG: hypothetical protein U0174_28040 [Polyangiaceae bacterium]
MKCDATQKTLKRTTTLVALAMLACAGVVVGCSDPAPQPSKAIVDITMTSVKQCPSVGPGWIEIGTFKRPDADLQPIIDGQQFNGRAVTVQCIVAPDGDAFSIQLSGKLQGTGSLEVKGKVKASGESTGITTTFSRDDFGTIRQSDCKFELYHAPGVHPNPAWKDPDVATGRIWGRVTCDNAIVSETADEKICKGVADFRFENCATTF